MNDYSGETENDRGRHWNIRDLEGGFRGAKFVPAFQSQRYTLAYKTSWHAARSSIEVTVVHGELHLVEDFAASQD